MPQPPIALDKFLSTPLPPIREAFPPGGGATGVKKDFEGNLKGISKIDGFEDLVEGFVKSLPTKPLPPHPSHPFPTFVSVTRELNVVVKNAQDVQQYLRRLPLAAIAASLSALKGYEQGIDFENLDGSSNKENGKKGAMALDRAGYESDGGEEPVQKSPTSTQLKGVKSYGWKFSKSPMGSGEFLLVEEDKPEDILLVVRTINSSAFSQEDWNEFVVDGPYHYNTKSKASWYWSRKFGASKRLGCRYFVFTDYQRWSFGAFTEDREHANISPIMSLASGQGGKGASVLEALFYWCRSAAGEKGGYEVVKKDVSSLPKPFLDNPPRRSNSIKGGAGKSGGRMNQVKVGNESDIEESDADA